MIYLKEAKQEHVEIRIFLFWKQRLNEQLYVYICNFDEIVKMTFNEILDVFYSFYSLLKNILKKNTITAIIH